MVEANWSAFTYDYAFKIDDFYASAFYFNSFHMIIQLILLSLMRGIVWEVFSVVESTSKIAEEI